MILWIDEIEKGISGGMGGGDLDGGTSSRVLGTLLTWMQEKTAPVYIVATANDVRSLRPELLRRFDDCIFVDLPSQKAREEILTVHLKKRGYEPDIFTGQVANLLYGFSGAEIEKVVREAIETAFYRNEKLEVSHLMDAAKQIVPVSMTSKNQIDDLRRWAQDSRARYAADPIEAKVADSNFSTGSRSVEL
jgi:SpoVK/Ycf46/Vps4 family AAA+-type ATPase